MNELYVYCTLGFKLRQAIGIFKNILCRSGVHCLVSDPLCAYLILLSFVHTVHTYVLCNVYGRNYRRCLSSALDSAETLKKVLYVYVYLIL